MRARGAEVGGCQRPFVVIGGGVDAASCWFQVPNGSQLRKWCLRSQKLRQSYEAAFPDTTLLAPNYVSMSSHHLPQHQHQPLHSTRHVSQRMSMSQQILFGLDISHLTQPPSCLRRLYRDVFVGKQTLHRGCGYYPCCLAQISVARHATKFSPADHDFWLSRYNRLHDSLQVPTRIEANANFCYINPSLVKHIRYLPYGQDPIILGRVG